MVDTLLSNGYCVKVFDINKTSINNEVEYYTGDINNKEVSLETKFCMNTIIIIIIIIRIC